MELLQFGSARALVGVRSEARGRVRKTGVLICPSVAMEYYRSHRALLLLAEQLAARGFETLRFDYSCMGDSAGDAADARVDDWIADIGVAARELREVSGVPRVCLLGLRLGALLAAGAVERGLRVEALALWDGPAGGGEWLEQIRLLDHAHYQRKNQVRTRSIAIEPNTDELLGMPFGPALAQGVAALRIPAPAADATPGVPARLDISSLDVSAAPGENRLQCPDAGFWTRPAWLTTPWAPPASIAAVAAQLEKWLP